MREAEDLWEAGMVLRSVEKAKDFKGAISCLFQYMGKYKFRFGLMFLFAIAGTIFNIVGPKIPWKSDHRAFQWTGKKGKRIWWH